MSMLIKLTKLEIYKLEKSKKKPVEEYYSSNYFRYTLFYITKIV